MIFTDFVHSFNNVNYAPYIDVPSTRTYILTDFLMSFIIFFTHSLLVMNIILTFSLSLLATSLLVANEALISIAIICWFLLYIAPWIL